MQKLFCDICKKEVSSLITIDSLPDELELCYDCNNLFTDEYPKFIESLFKKAHKRDKEELENKNKKLLKRIDDNFGGKNYIEKYNPNSDTGNSIITE